MYKRILVPLDGSRVAEGILPFVLEIAGPLDLEVVLVRVMPSDGPQPTKGTTRFIVANVPARLNEARKYLAPLAADLRQRGLRVTTDARYGFPVTEIVAAARKADADLIAMTTHSRSGLNRLISGSVAHAVLRQAEIPVLMMRLTERQVSSVEAA